jgi:hypothetical protein
MQKFKDRVKLGVSPSTQVSEMDGTKYWLLQCPYSDLYLTSPPNSNQHGRSKDPNKALKVFGYRNACNMAKFNNMMMVLPTGPVKLPTEGDN